MSDATRFGVDFSQLLAQAQSPQLPNRLRAVCCDVLRCLYIDRDPYMQIVPIFKTRVWSRVVQDIDVQRRSNVVATAGALSDVTLWKLKEVGLPWSAFVRPNVVPSGCTWRWCAPQWPCMGISDALAPVGVVGAWDWQSA